MREEVREGVQEAVQEAVQEGQYLQQALSSRRDKILRAYAVRNARRNLHISVDRKCKYCGVVWPKGSIKVQTFEGIQSMCKLSTRKCRNHAHYGRVFGAEV